MIAYLNIVSSLKPRQFKDNYLVMNHLKAEGVWLKIDKFEQKKIPNPGLIMDIHPKLTNIFMLKQEIEHVLRDVEINGAPNIREWKKKHECEEEDAGYLKTLLSLGYENKTITAGTFIPTVYHLMASVESYKAALRGQNNYINNMTAVAIKGVHRDAF
eukprot:7268836-Ditylum_brightwellii.AAC.1